jgi:gas vesicle protein
MGDYDDLPYIVIERKGGGVGPFLWGALLGAGAALLLAPRSGQETQDEIRRTARRLADAAGERVDDARRSVEGAVDRTRGAVTERITAVRGAVETKAEQARQAVQAGRAAARDARTELERRVDDAKVAYRAGVAGAKAVRAGASAPAAGADVDVVEVVVTEVVVEADPSDL